jgi:hypothetical protein
MRWSRVDDEKEGFETSTVQCYLGIRVEVWV